MKKLVLSLIAITAITLSSLAQAPEGFKYQAVVRDAANTILNNQAVGMRLTIQQGSIGGTAVYSETFTPTTNAYGLVNLEIGTGVSVDDLAAIDWSNGPYFMETAIDVTGGVAYVLMGTSQLMSVPYALYAKTAENVVNDQVDDADADPANEIQDISLAGTNLTISDGSTIDLASIDTQIDSIGIVALGFVAPVDYDSTIFVNTGVKWIDGKYIYKSTWVRSGTEYPNWSLTGPGSYETIVDYECKIIGPNPTTSNILINSPFVILSTDNPGAGGYLVLSNLNQAQNIQAGSIITVYYTQP